MIDEQLEQLQLLSRRSRIQQPTLVVCPLGVCSAVSELLPGLVWSAALETRNTNTSGALLNKHPVTLWACHALAAARRPGKRELGWGKAAGARDFLPSDLAFAVPWDVLQSD